MCFVSSSSLPYRFACISFYLQPGGEREWKVDRENISALSAIFFHKWLRATAENHEGSAVHSQSQDRGRAQPWTEVSLSTAPQMPPGRKPSIRRACSAPSNLQSTIHTSRAEESVSAEVFFRDRGNEKKSCFPPTPIRPGATWAHGMRPFSPRQMSAAVMLPVTQRIQASSAEIGRDEGGGGVEQRPYNVSAVTVWAGRSSPQARYAAKQRRRKQFRQSAYVDVTNLRYAVIATVSKVGPGTT